MQINFTGHQVEVTPALRQFTQEKFTRLNKHLDNIISVHVTFGVEKLEQIAEATIHAPKIEIHAREKANDMYSAVDGLIDKLVVQAVKHKEKMKEHHDA